MRHSEYSDRDYGFGQQVLALRTASNLTQSGLAELLGISRRAVVGWETGVSHPSPQHLKHFIKLCCQRNNVFHSGQEAEEIRNIMEEAEGSGHMLPGYEGYGRLLRRSAETKHMSCGLLTSGEKPLELAPLEGSRSPVRSLGLRQLDVGACGLLPPKPPMSES